MPEHSVTFEVDAFTVYLILKVIAAVFLHGCYVQNMRDAAIPVSPATLFFNFLKTLAIGPEKSAAWMLIWPIFATATWNWNWKLALPLVVQERLSKKN